MPTICTTFLVLAACSYASALSLSVAGRRACVLHEARPLHGVSAATVPPQLFTPTLAVTAAARAGPLLANVYAILQCSSTSLEKLVMKAGNETPAVVEVDPATGERKLVRNRHDPFKEYNSKPTEGGMGPT